MPPSLRYLLLRRLLPAMLAMLVAGASIAYWVALHSANLAYDRSLLNTALAVSEQARIVEGQPALQLTSQSQSILLADRHDSIHYSLRNTKGEVFSGDHLPHPNDALLARLREEGRVFYDSQWNGKPIRIAALLTETEGIELLVLAGETQNKRNSIVRDISLGMLLPEFLLIAATLFLVGVGVTSGLAPLTGLQRQLAGRSQADLSPIAADVPEEMQPLVVEINSLLHRLKHSLDSQRHFISDAAHQLRTPVAALQTQVEVALRQPDEARQGYLESIQLATRRLSHLISQLLALARAEPSQSAPLPLLNLESIVHEVAEIWLPQAIAKNVDLGFELAPVCVAGNRLLLTELLNNLVENALRHTPSGGSITVSCGGDGKVAWLTVEDSGAGIPPTEREKVFERFYQPADSDSDGCGLGLAIVKAIVRQHGGNVECSESASLGGARLEIRLPVAPSCGKG